MSGILSGVSSLMRSARWSPLNVYPTAKLYRADRGSTASGNATRMRVGLWAEDTGILAPNRFLVDTPLDGQAFIPLPSGRKIILGGAPGGHADKVVNTIWSSDDDCRMWTVLLANAAGSSTRPAPAHTFGCFTLQIEGVWWVYWLGGDPFTPTGDVFRILASALDFGGNPATPWTRISTTCPTSGLALYMYGTIGTDIYVIGGQTSIEDTGVPSKTTYKSTDYGVTWAALAEGFDCPADVFGAQVGPLPEKDGKLWIAGSGRYHSSDYTDFSNAVYSFDGTTWTEELPDGHLQFTASIYHSLVVRNGVLVRFNGATWDGVTFDGDTATCYLSTEGSTWTETTPVSWGATHAQAALATADGIYVTDGFQHDEIHAVRVHSGPLESNSQDQGSGNFDVSQATDAEKPILDPDAFGEGIPGLVFTKGQRLNLAEIDRGIATGNLEAHFGIKTLNFDVSVTEGSNVPGTILGTDDASVWNAFGLYGSGIALRTASPTTNTNIEDAELPVNDDQFHMISFKFTSEGNGTSYMFIDGNLVSTVTDRVFSTLWTGWGSIGAGFNGADGVECVLAFALILSDQEELSSQAFMSRLQSWAESELLQ